jgi:hypothetical protein
MPRYRRNAQFIDPRQHCQPIDRNQRARILWLAEQLERRSKTGRNGALGLTGLAVLRQLLRFANAKDGLCFPSYDALEAATGLCRRTIASCLKRLEAAGIIRVARRLVRQVVDGIICVRQGSNAYAFSLPANGQAYRAPSRVYRALANSTQKKITRLLRQVTAGLAMQDKGRPPA